MHKRRVRGGCCCLLFWLADLGVTFGKLQADGLGHVGVEPDALLQKNWPWRKKKKKEGGKGKRDKNRYLIKHKKNNYKSFFVHDNKIIPFLSDICALV